MPFAFTLTSEPRDASYLSLIDAEQLFNNNDKAGSDVRRNTLKLLTTNPIVVPHTWFVSERAWHTTQKVIATLQCALQYRHYVNKHTIQRRNVEMMKMCNKYKLQRDDALKQLKITCEENTKYKHELHTQLLQNKKAEHALSKLLSQRKRDIDENRCHMTGLSTNNASKAALTCSQCGNVYPSVKSLESHIIKRHKRSRTFAENIAQNIGSSTATAAAAALLVTNAETSLYNDLYNENNFNRASSPFTRESSDVYNLITGSVKSDTAASNELLELLQSALHTVNELHKESDLEVKKQREEYCSGNSKELLSTQDNKLTGNNVRNEENDFANTLLLPGMKSESVSNQITHNEENTSDTLRQLLQETLLHLQNFEARHMLHQQEKENLHLIDEADKQITAKRQESTNCRDAGVQTFVQQRLNELHDELLTLRTHNESMHEITPCPNWLKLPLANKMIANEEHIHNKKQPMQRYQEEKQHALDSQNTLTHEPANVQNATIKGQVGFSVDNVHDAKNNALTVDEHIEIMETSPSTAMAISPLTISPLSASNLPSPASLPPPPSSSLHVAPLPISTQEHIVVNNVSDEKPKPIGHVASTELHKENKSGIASLSDLAQTLIADPEIKKDKLIAAAVHASRLSTKTRCSDVNSTDKNDNAANDTVRSRSLSSSVNTTQVEKKQHEEREEEELQKKKKQEHHEQEEEQQQQYEQVEERKEKREIDVVPLKVESLAERRSTDKLDAPTFSISPKLLEPRKHTHSERNWLTDEYHVHEAITTSKAFIEDPVVLNLAAPQEEAVEEGEVECAKIRTTSPRPEKAHENKFVSENVKSKLKELEEEKLEKKEASAAPSETSQYAFDESSSSSSSSYSFTSTAESSKENDNYKDRRVLHDQGRREEQKQNMEKTTRQKNECTNAKLNQEKEKHESKHEQNTTHDDTTAFTISYDEEDDAEGEHNDHNGDDDVNDGYDYDEDTSRDSEDDEKVQAKNERENEKESSAKPFKELTSSTLDNNMSEKDPTRPTLANNQHEEYQQEQEQQEKKIGKGKHVSSLPGELHRSNDLSSYMYTDDVFTETDNHNSSHYLHSLNETPKSRKEIQESSKLEHLPSSKEQKLTDTDHSTSTDHIPHQHRRRHHRHHHHHQHHPYDQQNGEQSNLSSFTETRKQKEELEQNNKQKQVTRHNNKNNEQQVVHTESNSYISLRPNASTVSNTTLSQSTSRIHTLPNTYSSSLANAAASEENTAKANDRTTTKNHKTSLLSSLSLSAQDKWNAENNSRLSEQVDESKSKATNDSNNKKKKKKTIKNFFKNIFKSKDKLKNNS